MVIAWVVLFTVAWMWKSQSVQLAVAVANVVLTAYYAVKFIPTL
jgi:hypothetical protein